MNYLEIKVKIAKIAEKNYKEFFKALLSFETNVEDEVILEKVYDFYFNEDEKFIKEDKYFIRS